MPTSRNTIDVFGGYNHNLRIGDGEFFDMKNLTSSYYPVLSPRNKRGVYATPNSPQGLISKDALCYVDGTKLYINKKEVEGLVLTDTPKQLVSMGAYLIIMPDKKYVNTKDFTDMGSIEASFNSDKEILTVKYEMCKVDGTVYTNTTKASTPPENPTNMQLWIDTSSVPNVLKQYSSTNATWSQIATTYIRISVPNIARSFKQYDAVKITGLPSDISQFKDLEGKISPLWEAYHDKGDESIGRAEGTDDYIVVVGFLDEIQNKDTQLCLEMNMPILDYVIEAGNRLWGCRYGPDADGNIVNEIYASKLGDFKNWNCFMGLSTDSYSASCGTDGQWTGAITHLGQPLFFKENYIHKVYGNYPANFQVQDTACQGVQKGSENSLAIVNADLLYKSRNAVCAYDGSLPVEISSALGEVKYFNATAGSHGGKYYISMQDANGVWSLFVYDTAKGMWHKEDNLQATAFCSCDGEMYFIDAADKKIKTMFGSGTPEATPTKWMAETGIIGAITPDKKYLSRISVKMNLNVGTKLYIYVQYDSSGTWEHICTMNGIKLSTFTLPIRPKRCDHLRLKIEGEGEGKIYSITKTMEQGSDI
jgi:hypothetical protein